MVVARDELAAAHRRYAEATAAKLGKEAGFAIAIQALVAVPLALRGTQLARELEAAVQAMVAIVGKLREQAVPPASAGGGPAQLEAILVPALPASGAACSALTDDGMSDVLSDAYDNDAQLIDGIAQKHDALAHLLTDGSDSTVRQGIISVAQTFCKLRKGNGAINNNKVKH